MKDSAKKRARDMRYWNSRWPQKRERQSERHKQWCRRNRIIQKLAIALVTIAALCGQADAQSSPYPFPYDPNCATYLAPDCEQTIAIGSSIYAADANGRTGEWSNTNPPVLLGYVAIVAVGTPTPTSTPAMATQTATATPTATPAPVALITANKKVTISLVMNGAAWKCSASAPKSKTWTCVQ